MIRSFETSHRPRFRPGLLTPRYWPTWMGFGLIALMWLLPARARGWLAAGITHLTLLLPSKRRLIATTNLSICFPHLDQVAIDALLRRHARIQCEVYLSYGYLLFGSARQLLDHCDVTGLEHLTEAAAEGRGVIVLTPHCCAFEMAGQFLVLNHPTASMARLHTDNDALDWIINRARVRFGGIVYGNRQSMLPLIKAIRDGFWMFYLPDEDQSDSNGEFVPFYGTPKLTTATIGRLASACRAAVVPMVGGYCPQERRFVVRFLPRLENFPSGDPVVDATRMNDAVERLIGLDPVQYAWTQRIFRTRPPGAPPLYPDMASKERKRARTAVDGESR
jgi:Kdo2-lipid IVA lauroyltransferase/acyltransferase